MRTKLIIDGNTVYEIDEECLCQKEKSQKDAEKTEEKTDKRKRGGR